MVNPRPFLLWVFGSVIVRSPMMHLCLLNPGIKGRGRVFGFWGWGWRDVTFRIGGGEGLMMRGLFCCCSYSVPFLSPSGNYHESISRNIIVVFVCSSAIHVEGSYDNRYPTPFPWLPYAKREKGEIFMAKNRHRKKVSRGKVKYGNVVWTYFGGRGRWGVRGADLLSALSLSLAHTNFSSKTFSSSSSSSSDFD